MNIERRTSNTEHRIKERLRRSIFISVPVDPFFLAKKMAFIIDMMVARSDILIHHSMLSVRCSMFRKIISISIGDLGDQLGMIQIQIQIGIGIDVTGIESLNLLLKCSEQKYRLPKIRMLVFLSQYGAFGNLNPSKKFPQSPEP